MLHPCPNCGDKLPDQIVLSGFKKIIGGSGYDTCSYSPFVCTICGVMFFDFKKKKKG